MQCEVRVSLPCNTPVIGCEINPHLNRGSGRSLNFTWYRELGTNYSRKNEQITCCVHHTEVATIQCMSCVELKIPVEESYHCSTKCFSDTWQKHRARHHQAAETVSITSKRIMAVGKLRSCGSWSSDGSWSAFGNDSLLEETEITAEREGKSWIRVGSSRNYVPSMSDYGYRLMLAYGTDDDDLVDTSIIITDPVIYAPVTRHRCMVQIRPPEGSRSSNFKSWSSPGSFRVLTYNLLSDYLTGARYNYCKAWALPWEYRRKKLLREIVGYEADILCLQEVQSDHFENFFEPELVKRGYAVIYKKKAMEMYTANRYITDGCATFYRRDRFKEIMKYEIEFNKIAWSMLEELQLSEKANSFRLTKDNVALVVILEFMHSDPDSEAMNSRICVANTHIHANSEVSDVKLFQVATLINGLEKIAASDIPILICGDLNSLPRSAPHELIVTARVDPVYKGTLDPVGIFQHVKLHHLLFLASAYSSLLLTSNSQEKMKMDPQTREPLYTNFTVAFAGTLDYIFYTVNSLTVEGLLELLGEEELTKETAIPSPEWPSDHIALMATFALKPIVRKKTPTPPPVNPWLSLEHCVFGHNRLRPNVFAKLNKFPNYHSFQYKK